MSQPNQNQVAKRSPSEARLNIRETRALAILPKVRAVRSFRISERGLSLAEHDEVLINSTWRQLEAATERRRAV